MTSRRHFLTQSTVALGASLGFTDLFASEFPDTLDFSDIDLAGKKILFQGDSITDAGRQRGVEGPNRANALGYGYAAYLATFLMGKQPFAQMEFFNRGISGNKVFQLAERWQADCIDLQPDIVSIMIGVNDYWHTFTHGYEGTVETYENDLRTLLHVTQKALPNVKFMLCEPFFLPKGTAIPEEWNADVFQQYQEIVRVIAIDFDAVFVPFQDAFNKALKLAPTEHWCPDGVHPSPGGSYLMAKAWLKGFAKL